MHPHTIRRSPLTDQQHAAEVQRLKAEGKFPESIPAVLECLDADGHVYRVRALEATPDDVERYLIASRSLQGVG